MSTNFSQLFSDMLEAIATGTPGYANLCFQGLTNFPPL